MYQLKNEDIFKVSGGKQENTAECKDGYINATINVPPHPNNHPIGVIIAIPGTDLYKQIEHLLPKV
jgi:hypothetical protein